MPFATTDDGVRLHYEETGSGSAVIFVHEFAGDHRSWEPQLRHFGKRHRCIAFNARGYPPSDVPEEVARLLAGARGGRHRARCSIISARRRPMSSAFRWAASRRCISASAIPAARSRSASAAAAMAPSPTSASASAPRPRPSPRVCAPPAWQPFAEKYAYGPTRVQFENKDPRGFAEFKAMLAQHSALGSANTQLGVQRERPSLYDLVEEMRRLTVPTLILHGDEDWPCLKPGILMKQNIPSAALAVMPNCGHTINLEEPDEFNRLVGGFIAQVESGRWPMRDPRALSSSITGMRS